VFNFVFDRRNDSRPYPNLAPMMDNPHDTYHGMGDTYPRIAPCRLLLYCADHGYPCAVSYTNEAIPPDAFYPVGLAWFDYSIDYFAMIPSSTMAHIQAGRLKILFYYHEGDNPFRERERLDNLCAMHGLSVDSYRFVSGNTQADSMDRFVYFPDHELFYWRNGVRWNGHDRPRAQAHDQPRGRQFTMLSRIHKWWRATIVSLFHQQGLLSQAYWSYGDVTIGDRFEDNPIQLSRFAGLESRMQEFLSGGPYRCDDLTAEEHNSHWVLAEYLYSDSYCSFVMETLYDAEQSGGAFITEKTFKAILNAHPFVIFGCPGTLAILRKLGYRTFDTYLDNSYDAENHNTERFIRTMNTVQHLLSLDLHAWYQQCLPDILHNQALFVSSKYDRLHELSCKLLSRTGVQIDQHLLDH